MRRAWWLGVLLVACDFDAAYERRCDAGGCASSDAGSAGGQGGGATAGGSSGGGATAGGSSGGGATAGGSSCPTPLALEVNVLTPAPISATACVHLDIGLRCQGVRLDAGVPIEVRVNNRSHALGRPGTLFSNPACTALPFTFTTGDVYFNSTVAGLDHMFGNYEVVVDAGVSASRVVQLEAGIEGAAATVLLPINTCLTLPPISFVGLTDALPVRAPGPQRFTGPLVPPLVSCGAMEVLVPADQSNSSVTPQVMAAVPELAGASQSFYGDAGFVTYLVRPCVSDGGAVSSGSECCQPFGVTNLVDGGFVCL